MIRPYLGSLSHDFRRDLNLEKGLHKPPEWEQKQAVTGMRKIERDVT